MHDKNHTRKAFSLIEIMVVLCLCCFLAGLTLINFSFLDDAITRIELDKLMTACLYMQQLAIATNEEKYLVFDEYKNEYYFDTYREKLSKRVRFGILPNIKGPSGSPTGTITKAITFPNLKICFYPTGIISSGTIYMNDINKHILYALSNAVSHFSYLRMYRYDNGWKLYGKHQ